MPKKTLTQLTIDRLPTPQRGQVTYWDSRPKQDDYWLNIGVAFPHEDGEGFNVILQALPLHGSGKVVLRAYDPQKHEAEEKEKQSTVKKARAKETA